jgi:enoyl-CoA hydratase/carnithine racemase
VTYTHADAGLALQEEFFSTEYCLDYRLAELNACRPVVALYDGIVMGGGVGVSINAAFRVATEASMFAMPETGIGFFPDVSGSFFLPRLRQCRPWGPAAAGTQAGSQVLADPGAGVGLGLFLGLTGARLVGRDLVTTGVATHYVLSELLPALTEALEATNAALAGTPASFQAVQDILERFSAESSEREASRTTTAAAAAAAAAADAGDLAREGLARDAKAPGGNGLAARWHPSDVALLNGADSPFAQMGRAAWAARRKTLGDSRSVQWQRMGAAESEALVRARAPLFDQLLDGLRAAGGDPATAQPAVGVSQPQQRLAHWCSVAQRALLKASPTACKVTVEQLSRGAEMTLDECFTMEMRLARQFMCGPGSSNSQDFYRGVDALLVSKTGKPNWQPVLRDVTADRLVPYFAPASMELDVKLQALVKM